MKIPMLRGAKTQPTLIKPGFEACAKPLWSAQERGCTDSVKLPPRSTKVL